MQAQRLRLFKLGAGHRPKAFDDAEKLLILAFQRGSTTHRTDKQVNPWAMLNNRHTLGGIAWNHRAITLESSLLQLAACHQPLAADALAQQLSRCQLLRIVFQGHGDKCLLISGVTNQRIRTIEQAPTLGKRQGEIQIGMVETLAATHASFSGITKGQTFQTLEKSLAIDLLLTGGQGPCRAQHLLQTTVVIRMGIEQPVVAARRLLLTARGGLVEI